MDFIIKTPAFMGDIVGLYVVAEAMARTYSTANGTTKLHRPAYEADLKRHCKWIADEARSEKLSICGGDKLPTTWAILMAGGEPLDDGVACARAWISVTLLNTWAATHGHRFLVETEGVPWIDERGVMGGPIPHLEFTEHRNNGLIAHKKSITVAGPPSSPKCETAAARQARRYQACLDDGLLMPTDPSQPLPRGYGRIAKEEGISHQAFKQDVYKHIDRLWRIKQEAKK